MSKDPAFLFYSNDFDAATKFFTHEQVGKYLRLLIAQHQHGHLSDKQMTFICGSHDVDVFDKFQKDDTGMFFNQRLEAEVNRRKSFSESRSLNRKRGIMTKTKDNIDICQTSVEHMGQHMETEAETETITEISSEGGVGETISEHVTQNTFVIRKQFKDSIWGNDLEAFCGHTHTIFQTYKPQIKRKLYHALMDNSNRDNVRLKDDEWHSRACKFYSNNPQWYTEQNGYPANGNGSKYPLTESQRLTQAVNAGGYLSADDARWCKIPGTMWSGNLSLDEGLIVFYKAGKNHLTIDPKDGYKASRMYELKEGNTIQDVHQHLLTEKSRNHDRISASTV